jgi:N-acetylglucosaminyldiphosphoundecaprenol N-acetyl-beta-D-mannosaminyltransferase
VIRRQTAPVLGARIDVLGWDDALARVAVWANQRESRVVCFCNAHAVVTYGRDAEFAKAIDSADLAAPDGVSVAWMLRLLGHSDQPRISGPDLMLACLEQAEVNEHSVFLLGSTKETLVTLRKRLRARYPKLQMVGALSPPFRPLSAEEDARIVQHIQRSGAQLLFVALGCPRQEQWMAAHRGQIASVMIGVGAAFDFHAGALKRAPRWMRSFGLEWLHRLMHEPKRLAWRYLDTNVVFLMRAIGQLMARPFQRAGRPPQ